MVYDVQNGRYEGLDVPKWNKSTLLKIVYSGSGTARGSSPAGNRGATPHTPWPPTAATNKTTQDPRPRALRHFFNVVKYPEKRLTWLASDRTKSREYGTSHYTVYIKKHLTGDGLAFGYYAKPLIFKHKPQNIMRNRYLGQLAVICCLIDGSCVSEYCNIKTLQ